MISATYRHTATQAAVTISADNEAFVEGIRRQILDIPEHWTKLENRIVPRSALFANLTGAHRRAYKHKMHEAYFYVAARDEESCTNCFMILLTVPANWGQELNDLSDEALKRSATVL